MNFDQQVFKHRTGNRKVFVGLLRRDISTDRGDGPAPRTKLFSVLRARRDNGELEYGMGTDQKLIVGPVRSGREVPESDSVHRVK
jgi:hypothetical protein